jgi:hypothetical protein
MTPPPPPRLVEIPVEYGGELGPDLEDVARHTGFSAGRVVELFSSAEYVVYFVGFSTCFPYLGGLPPELATPRLSAPRKHVPVGSVAIGLLLIVISIVLAVEMKGLLIGESASPARQLAIANAIKDSPEVQGIIHMKTEHIGPDELLVGVKVGFEPSLTIRDLADAINGVERRIRAAVPEARIIYIEPDVLRELDEFPEIDVPQDVDEALP